MKLRHIRGAQNRKNKIISSKCASGYVASRTFMQMDPNFEQGVFQPKLAVWFSGAGFRAMAVPGIRRPDLAEICKARLCIKIFLDFNAACKLSPNPLFSRLKRLSEPLESHAVFDFLV